VAALAPAQEKAYLGVSLTGSDGRVLINSITGGSPAERCGLQADDVVVAVGGEPVSQPDQVVDAIAARRPGSELAIEVRRGGQQLTLLARLAAKPGSSAGAPPPVPAAPAPAPALAPAAPNSRPPQAQEELRTQERRIVRLDDRAEGAEARRLVDIALAQEQAAQEQERAARLRILDAREAQADAAEAAVAELRLKLDATNGDLRERLLEISGAEGQGIAVVQDARPFLGVILSDDAGAGGARIDSVVEGSAAEKAGLEEGDVVIIANGEAIADAEDLRAVIRGSAVGERLKLEVERDGEVIELKAKLGQNQANTVGAWPQGQQQIEIDLEDLESDLSQLDSRALDELRGLGFVIEEEVEEEVEGGSPRGNWFSFKVEGEPGAPADGDWEAWAESFSANLEAQAEEWAERFSAEMEHFGEQMENSIEGWQNDLDGWFQEFQAELEQRLENRGNGRGARSMPLPRPPRIQIRDFLPMPPRSNRSETRLELPPGIEPGQAWRQEVEMDGDGQTKVRILRGIRRGDGQLEWQEQQSGAGQGIGGFFFPGAQGHGVGHAEGHGIGHGESHGGVAPGQAGPDAAPRDAIQYDSMLQAERARQAAELARQSADRARLEAEMQAMRAQQEALRAELEALRAERDALRKAQRDGR
jgi:membrane-associated protease RseP (regulator of RpoE activity)